MPSDAERRPDRSPLDWLGPIPSDPDRDPYYIHELKEENGYRESLEGINPIWAAYAHIFKRAVEFDWLKIFDFSWFVAEWHGMPRWKWAPRVFVALLLIGPALALFGFLILGWYR